MYMCVPLREDRALVHTWKASMAEKFIYKNIVLALAD